MPKLRTNNSSGNSNTKDQNSNLDKLLKSMSLVKKSLLSGDYGAETGDVEQSSRVGLASALGFGGAYIAAERLAKKAKTLTKGIKSLFSGGKGDDVEEEDVFSKSEQTKQPGFFGIAGLAKNGFRRVVKAIKGRKKQEEKTRKSLFERIVKGFKSLFSNKWFWISLGVGILGAGIWGLISNYWNSRKQEEELRNIQREAALNSTPILDSDLLDSAREEQYWNEFEETLAEIRKSGKRASSKFKEHMDDLTKKIDKSAEDVNLYGYTPVGYDNKGNPYGISSPTPMQGVTPNLPSKVPYGQGHLFNSPLMGSYRISSGFGARVHPITGVTTFHKGIDLATYGKESLVLAARGGRVVHVGYDEKIKNGKTVGYGRNIIIQHDNGLYTRYAHLKNDVRVTKGQTVLAGEAIGNVGMTGGSTGHHLHFEVMQNVNGKLQAVNPEQFMAFNGEGGSLSGYSINENMDVSNILSSLIPGYSELDKAICSVLNDKSRVKKMAKEKKWVK